MENTRNTILGFYQNDAAAQDVLKTLRHKGYKRSLSIHRSSNDRLTIHPFRPSKILTTILLSLILSDLVLFFLLPEYHTLFETVFSILIAMGICLVYTIYLYAISKPVLARYLESVLKGETLIIAQMDDADVRHGLHILRHVESDHPITFLLRGESFEEFENDQNFVNEPATIEQLEAEAVRLAKLEQHLGCKISSGHPLKKRLRQRRAVLEKIRRYLAEGEQVEQTVPISGSWLLDNDYIIQENIREIERSLPLKYYRQLPKIIDGTNLKLPRIYTLAVALIDSCANRLNENAIISFLKSYQTVQPLTIGELWAMPLMLRLHLIERIQSLAVLLDHRLREGELAKYWGNRLLTAARRQPEQLDLFLRSLKEQKPNPSPHFIEELLEHLFDEDAILAALREWLEVSQNTPLNEIIQKEQRQEAINEVAFSSAVISLISLRQLSWREIFEKTSVVDAILNNDPAGIYRQMNFSTRNSYREAIEVFARHSQYNESEIAKMAIEMAQSGTDEVLTHVGYYLIDQGAEKLEKNIDFAPALRCRFRKILLHYPTQVYLGSIALIMTAIEFFLYAMADHMGGSHGQTIFFMLLSLFPASEIAVQLMHLIVPCILPPHVLPKMDFAKGVPEKNKTFVVIPMMLTSEKAFQASLHQLEIHYLANSDPVLKFGLLLDYPDAPAQVQPGDAELLDYALKGMQQLTNKYGSHKFFLFLRSRTWSDSESAWIGWERKRGKLETLNRFLTDPAYPGECLRYGEREDLKDTRYVITLDGDTRLPKDKAIQLIETIVHPLNAARIRTLAPEQVRSSQKTIERGYTIIQPRVSTDISQPCETWFAKIYSDVVGINPYTQATSDIYQDLMHEGSYHGKCIYDVNAFDQILSNQFPEEHLLSHDLIEGAYVRVAYASDISLFDQFPQTYQAWSMRHHRWMRGDWQIIDWLFSKVPTHSSDRQSTPPSLLNRWKIFDNFRRALSPPVILSLMVSSWIISSDAVIWNILLLSFFLTPIVSALLQNALNFFYEPIFKLRQILYLGTRVLISISLLPHQAMLSIDALVRVCYRRCISHRHLLQWQQSNDHSSSKEHRYFLYKFFCISIFSLVVLKLVFDINPSALIWATPICILWLISPLVVFLLDNHRLIRKRPLELVTPEDREFLRNSARKTWRYFDDFVGSQSNWLPPDNFQASLKVEVAPRTSPTNIGLWMLAAISAYDLKYLTFDEALERIKATFETLGKLETYQGHILNWYDTNTLKALHPRYVSTVDNGNLLSSLWTLQQAIDQIIKEPVCDCSLLSGCNDTFQILCEEMNNDSFAENLRGLHEILSSPSKNLVDTINQVQSALSKTKTIRALKIEGEEPNYWAQALEYQLNSWNECIKRYLEWAVIASEFPLTELELSDKNLSAAIGRSLQTSPSLHSLASGALLSELSPLLEAFQSTQNLQPSMISWANRFKEALHKARWFAGERIELAKNIIDRAHQISESTKMQFLYSQERKLFSIGFQVEDCKLDHSFYDLLASEARIASLVSIAKGDVPLEHWWSLGRPYRIIKGKKILVSWAGTMFEYLMPLLYTKYYPDSLLGNAYKNALYFQMRYAKKRGIPWGISEAAFSEIDTHKIYQYRSFGVPELGFKRGLEKDLVVSPYSTALSLSIDPISSVKNFRNLRHELHDLYSTYGFYESIDFSRQKGPAGERGIITYAFMAHHQGMSLLAFNNLLNNNIMQERFHSDPRIKGVESLLYEQVPANPPLSQGYKREAPIARLTPFTTAAIMGVLNTPHTSTPKINLLANGSYSVMLTNTGGGYSKWDDIDITRWRADTTCDMWGSFCYIKDTATGDFWSSTYHPTMTKGQKFSVKFKSDKVEFKRRDHDIETTTEIAVSPQDNTEVRLVTIANLSRRQRQIELTSYSELALSQHKTDRSHPAFNKMFIQTEKVPELNGIIAFRRLRKDTEQPIWVAHVIASDQPAKEPLQFETDRKLFVGRGNTLVSPAAMRQPLTQSEGFVLDPIFSLRKAIVLEPGQRVQVAFITTTAKDKDALIGLMKKYNEMSAVNLCFEMAWTHAQLDLRHLRIHQEEAQLYQKLASHILYPHSQLRISHLKLVKNCLTQSSLWAHSISGDLPIVVISIADIHEADLVKQILTAHAFWRMRGLQVDLIILNEEADSYEHPLYEQLNRIVHSQNYGIEMGKPGGVFLLNVDHLSKEEVLLILSVARVHLVAARGFLRQHLASPIEPTHYPSRLVVNKKISEVPSQPLSFLELPYFNGIGGFTGDGKEYVIYLGHGTHTPAPWINVIANPQFGTIVTESGLGVTWYGNSQTNRLTPWSNDALLNPICDTLYIRDDQTGAFWTPAPSPVRELDAYRIRHGQGYTCFEHNSHGIEQNLTVFVPCDESDGLPLRIQKLSVLNRSSNKRTLSLFSYSELVLGTDKEETQMHVCTSWDLESQGLFAFNNYNCDYANHVAFVCSNERVSSFSGNRTEFIGRNHNLANPAALRRKSLSGQTGAGFDPCAALHVNIELQPGEQKEVVFALGFAPTVETARQLILLCKDHKWIDNVFIATQSYWDKILGTLRFECPDLFINFALNRWLLYQNLSCRLWGRSGFYQSSGAYGFRDQLQDVMALLYTNPEMARKQILKTAAQQFVEGDVQHWWLPPSNSGVRTRISDDLLWLPFVTAQYVRVTNDASILNEIVPFIEGDLLKENQHESFFTPIISKESATLLEHCRRAVNKGTTVGPHGLPLIGGGDWNDGMNNVGILGKGESIWLGWFLIHVLHDFAYLLTASGQTGAETELHDRAQKLAALIEKNGWDGEWYLRAYMDDGTPLGSKNNSEDMIDSLSQSWAIISGAADPQRAKTALDSAERYLVRKDDRMVLLLTPPFDKTPLDPGYIKGYPPGVRENGGQYTHGSLWVAQAFAKLRDGETAAQLLHMMHPVTHTSNMEAVNRYKIEPYVTAGDVYALAGKVGHGGWSWYTGSAGWMYRIWLEDIFGFSLRGDFLTFEPTFPKTWETAKILYKYHSATYAIAYENPQHLSGSAVKIELDGVQLSENHFQLADDGMEHHVRVIICG